MVHLTYVIDTPDQSDSTRSRNRNSERILENNELDDHEVDETDIEITSENIHYKVQPDDNEVPLLVYNMDCSLFRTCDRCTENEYTRIMECQTGSGRIITYRCTTSIASSTTTTTIDETIEGEPNYDKSTATTTSNGDREVRSYQEYRKDDTYYDKNDETLPSSSLSSILTPSFTYLYESCPHTKDEYEFNYIQFQVFICLLGIISLYSIRKQKMFAASLFDQRRMKNTTTTTNTANGTSSSNVSRTNSNSSSRGIVIQRSNTGLMMNHNNNNTTNEGNHGSIEMKALLSSSINDMDIV